MSEGQKGRAPVRRGEDVSFYCGFLFFPQLPWFPPLALTVQVRISENVRKNSFLNLLFLAITRYATSHTGQRGTPPGERGREKENRSKNRHFPPSSPDRRPSPLSASLTSPRHAGSHPLRFSSLDSLFPHPYLSPIAGFCFY